MRLSRFSASTLFFSFLAGLLCLFLASGCTAPATEEDGSDDPPPPKKAAPWTPMESSGKGSLKGRVTLVGGLPDVAKLDTDIEAMISKATSGKGCGNHQQQTWKIGNANGLGNVVVMLRPEKNQFFPVDPAILKDVKPEVAIDQPGCAFTQHVVVVFPRYPDPKDAQNWKKDIPTGQKLVILNSEGDVSHSFKYAGTVRNAGIDVSVQPKARQVIDNLFPDNAPLNGLCGVHPWMGCWIWLVDNPYFAITKDDGTFEIPNVPAGKCRIMAWHEALGVQGPDPIELKAGENVRDFTLKYK